MTLEQLLIKKEFEALNVYDTDEEFIGNKAGIIVESSPHTRRNNDWLPAQGVNFEDIGIGNLRFDVEGKYCDYPYTRRVIRYKPDDSLWVTSPVFYNTSSYSYWIYQDTDDEPMYSIFPIQQTKDRQPILHGITLDNPK
jgi:hypothetical protein